MNTANLITTHLYLECIAIDERGDLFPIPCPNPDPVPRFYIARHTDYGTFSRFARHDLHEELRERLLTLPPEEVLHRHDMVKSILAPYGICKQFHYGKSYVCPNSYTREDYPDVVRLTVEHGPLIQEYDARLDPAANAVFAVIVDGRIASTCQSSRENETAAESWVRTLAEHRRRGFARQVTAAWAANASANHKLPFYSHRMDNLRSQGVARSLGLGPFIVDAAYP